MKKPCKHCCSSGNYVDYVGYEQPQTTAIGTISPIRLVPCRYCNGNGYIDEDEIVAVPRKYVKDEFYDRRYCPY